MEKLIVPTYWCKADISDIKEDSKWIFRKKLEQRAIAPLEKNNEVYFMVENKETADYFTLFFDMFHFESYKIETEIPYKRSTNIKQSGEHTELSDYINTIEDMRTSHVRV